MAAADVHAVSDQPSCLAPVKCKKAAATPRIQCNAPAACLFEVSPTSNYDVIYIASISTLHRFACIVPFMTWFMLSFSSMPG